MPAVGVPSLSPDDYHLGEVYLPWMQWRDFGLVSYAGFDPARGLNQTLVGYLSDILFVNGNNAAAITSTLSYKAVFLLILFAIAITWLTNGFVAAIILLLIPLPTHLILEPILFALLLFDKRVIARQIGRASV